MKYKWSDLITLEYGKPVKDKERTDGKYPVFGTNGQIGTTNLPPLCNHPSFILGRKGAYRGVHYSAIPFSVIDTAFYAENLHSELLDIKWAYYKFLTYDINGMDSGSAIPSTDRYEIYSIEVDVPDLKVQKQIVNILECFDTKIELNTRMNKVLEEIAQSLFKHWFVDFEFPNEEGKPYLSSGGKMVDSEMGQIPEGWVIKPLDEIADFLNGVACQRYPAKENESSLPVIKIRELNNQSTDMADRASLTVPEKYRIKNGDVLFSWSGTLLVDIWCSGEGALNQHLFKVSSMNYPKWFYYYWTKYHLAEFQHIASSKATTMGHIQRKHLSESLTLVPDNKTMFNMSQIMDNIIEMIITANLEKSRLADIRDLLLPKLMTGNIEINEIH